MEDKLKTSKKVVLVIFAVLFLISMSSNVFAAKIYTNDLKKGDILKFKGTQWNVYKSVSDAKKAEAKNAIDILTKGDKVEILGISSNVIKIAKGKYIYYGPTASNFFKKIEPKKTELHFENATEVIEMGQALNLANKLTVVNGKKKDVKWESSNEKVATVNKKGNVTPIGPQKTIITATLNDAKATCTVIVTSKQEIITVSKVELDQKVVKSMNVGEQIKLTATVTVTPNKSGNRAVKFTSSNPEAVSVNENTGAIKALKRCDEPVLITATSRVDESKKAVFKIKRVLQPVTAINLKGSVDLKVGDKTALEIGILPSDASNQKVQWESTNTDVATVSKSGVVKAKGKGKAKIKVTAKDGSDVYAVCVVKVTEKAMYNGVELQYSARYNVCDNPLTKRVGVVYYNGHKETYYSQRVLPGGGLTALNNNGRHVADDGTIRDKDGYIAVACNYLSQGSTIMTSLGPGKVYDTGTMTGKWIDIYVDW